MAVLETHDKDLTDDPPDETKNEIDFYTNGRCTTSNWGRQDLYVKRLKQELLHEKSLRQDLQIEVEHLKARLKSEPDVYRI